MPLTYAMIKRMAQYPAIRAAFVQMFDPTYDSEMPRFLFATADYRRAPSRAAADAILNTYIVQGAPEGVNLSAPNRIAVENSVAALTLPAFASYAANALAAFDPAINEVITQINNGQGHGDANSILDRFLLASHILG